MTFGSRAPEALLGRSDSKNPATTCKGLTTAGRLCRRALAANAISPSRSPQDRDTNGVVAILDQGEAAAFFCWQHKDQAEQLVSQLQVRSRLLSLKHKSSIDTLVDRLGVINLNEEERDVPRMSGKSQPNKTPLTTGSSRKRDTLPQEWRNMQGPLMSIPEDVLANDGLDGRRHPVGATSASRNRRTEPKRRPTPKMTWFCCGPADEDVLPAPRRRQPHSSGRPRSNVKARHDSEKHQNAKVWTSTVSHPHKGPDRRAEMQQQPGSKLPFDARHPRCPLSETQSRGKNLPKTSNIRPSNLETSTYLSLIPPHLPPSTTSALLAELARPISEADTSGYIYMFWLTPETSTTQPDGDMASSILDDSQPLTPRALTRYASSTDNQPSRPPTPPKITLKIGRARNVHRRLTQWSRQCGQNLTLIRYYPHHAQLSPPLSQSTTVTTARPIPNVHRVERLIHLELADQRVSDKEDCGVCGRAHREWFEVEATREGVRRVDGVIRRWVAWAERGGGV